MRIARPIETNLGIGDTLLIISGLSYLIDDEDRHEIDRQSAMILRDRIIQEVKKEALKQMKSMEAIVRVNNTPEDESKVERYIVARFWGGEPGMWFWGSWNDPEKAQRAADEVGGIVLERIDMPEMACKED